MIINIALGIILALAWFAHFNNPKARWFGSDLDNSDLSTSKRSGMIVLTDYGTVVQYLVTPWGSISPRYNKDGTLTTIEKNG